MFKKNHNKASNSTFMNWRPVWFSAVLYQELKEEHIFKVIIDCVFIARFKLA